MATLEGPTKDTAYEKHLVEGLTVAEATLHDVSVYMFERHPGFYYHTAKMAGYAVAVLRKLLAGEGKGPDAT